MRVLDKYPAVKQQLKEIYEKEFFDNIVGLTDAQANYIQREEAEISRTERDLLFLKENTSHWKKMLSDDCEDKHSTIYKAYVDLFGLPEGLYLD